MPTEIIIDSQKYWRQLKNGVSFGNNPSDYTVNLVGNVGERIKVETELSVYAHAITTPTPWNPTAGSFTFFKYTDSIYQLLRNTGDFIADGLAAGDTVEITWMDSNGVAYGPYLATIGSISSTQIIFTGTPMWGGFALPDSATNGGYSLMDVVVTSWLTALIFKFGLLGNTEVFNDTSKVSLNEQAYYGAGIGADDGYGNRITSDITLTKLGNFQDWISGSAKVAYASTTGNWQKFTIAHEFILTPWFLKEWQENFDDGTIPTLLAGTESLKYAIDTEFRTVLSNPNTAKEAKNDTTLGCIGFFNENFNGFNNVYSMDSIVYTDSTTGDSVAGVQLARKTKAIITISKTGGSFNAGDPCGVMISFCPNDTSYYQNKLTTLEENFVYDNAINDEGAATVAGANNIIKTFVADIVTTKLVITAEFQFTSAQILLMIDTPKFIIGCFVADDNLTNANSDQVMLLADYSDGVASEDIHNLFGITDEKSDFRIFRHDLINGTQQTLWDEDGVNAYYKFWLDTSKSARIDTLDFALIAYNSVTDDYFVLDKRSLNVAGSPIVGGIQQLNVSTNRGYKLDTSDFFDEILLQMDILSGPYQYYKLNIGQKIKWQDWIQNLFTSTDFYDGTKLNNNLNYKSDNYCSLQSGDTDWSIRVMLLANVYGVNSLSLSGNTIYRVISPEQKIYDYDKPTYWTATLETYDKTGSINLGGAVRTDDDTLMRITWQFVSALSASDVIWAIHRIEETQENGDNIYEHSSIVDRIPAAPFKDQTGATALRLKVTIDTANNRVITENLIDYTKLDPNKTYKISGRINYTSLTIPFDAKITEDGIVKIAEPFDIKEIE